MGLDTKKLQKLVDQHMSLPFPRHSDHEELEAWILDLAELDGYCIGIAQSLLHKRSVECLGLSDMQQMEERLQRIVVESEVDQQILASCAAYLVSLQRIRCEIIRSQND